MISFTNPTHAEWRLVHSVKETGEVLYDSGWVTNVVTDNGRNMTANCVFGLSASATLVALGAGACSTTAVHTDTRLNYEHILNAQRKTLTNTSGALLTNSDVGAASFSDSFGEPYYKKITIQSVYDGSVDSNVNQPFQEFGLFTTTALPATPTSTSGTCWNHLVNGSPITLTSSTVLTIQVTVYF